MNFGLEFDQLRQMEPWYKVVQPRAEVREGRSFNPDEFAIALEQVAAGTAPEDYTDPNKFFGRTCFTQALREHMAMVLRRLNGETVNAAPVLTLITQFGGGKTHTLTERQRIFAARRLQPCCLSLSSTRKASCVLRTDSRRHAASRAILRRFLFDQTL